MQTNVKRPNEVKSFEIMQLTTLVIGIVISALAYERLTEISTPLYILTMQFSILLVMLWIILSITRKKSKIAKWILVIVNLIGIPVYIPHLSTMLNNGVEGWLSVLQLAINLSSLYFLFQPTFIDYLKSKKE